MKTLQKYTLITVLLAMTVACKRLSQNNAAQLNEAQVLLSTVSYLIM